MVAAAHRGARHPALPGATSGSRRARARSCRRRASTLPAGGTERAVVEQSRDGRTLDDFARRRTRGLSADETALLALLRSWRIPARARPAGAMKDRQGRPPRAARATALGTGEPLLPTPVPVPGGSGRETSPAFRIRGRVVSALHGRRAEPREAGRPPGAPLLLEPALGSGPPHVEPRRVVRRDREEATPRRAGGHRRKRGARTGIDVSTVPTLVLLRGKTVVDRLDGRATGKQISRMISPHVVAR